MSFTADKRYGRRGGGWLPKPPTTPARESAARAPATTDPAILFHPQTIATTRAHQRRPCRQRPCTCQPDPDDLAGLWAGRARMAAARQAAGLPLGDLDRQALDRQRDQERA